MRIAKLEKDRTLKKHVITRLAKGERQWDIARSLGLNQATISRFYKKHKAVIDSRKAILFERFVKRATSQFMKKYKQKLKEQQSLYPWGFRRK